MPFFHFLKKVLRVEIFYIWTGFAFFYGNLQSGQASLILFQSTKTLTDHLTDIVVSAL